MKKNILWICILTIGILNIIGCGKKSEQAQDNQFRPLAKVTTYQIEARNVPYILEKVGSLESDEVHVKAKVEGIITKVNFKEGDTVAPENPVLAEIDPEKFNLERLKAQAEEERAQAVYAKAKDDYQKRKTLFEKSMVTQDEVASFKTTLKEKKADWHSAHVAFEMALKNERESKITAPVSGIIQSKSVVLGAYVRPDTQIASLLDLNSVRVQFSASTGEAMQLAVGQIILFSLQENSTQKYQAEIFFIGQSAHPQTRMIDCKANKIRSVSGENIASIISGSFVKIEIETHVHKDAVLIPSEAVLPTEQGLKVFILQQDKVHEQMIESGVYTQDGQVEILKGLAIGDTIIVKGANALRDDMNVEVVNVAKS